MISIKPKKRSTYIAVSALVFVIIFVVVVFAYLQNNATKAYTAVFMQSGQVYFGQIQSESSGEIVLNNIYYLQFSEAKNTSDLNSAENDFKLIKRGSELHGPEGSMKINKTFVIFTENLKPDSKIISTIAGQV